MMEKLKHLLKVFDLRKFIKFGLIGVLNTLVGTAVGIPATPTPAAIVISFSVSVGIGLLFGYMPANRAANLNPIDALRSE